MKPKVLFVGFAIVAAGFGIAAAAPALAQDNMSMTMDDNMTGGMMEGNMTAGG
jgi:hypothetical protein